MAILYDFPISPLDLTNFVRRVPVDTQFVLDQLLPNRFDNVLEVDLAAETVLTTRAAKARAWDAPPMPGRRDGFTTRKAKLPAISQFMARGERDRLELERLRSGGQSTSAIENAIFDDAATNARAIQTRVEMMRGDLLTDGKVTIAELGDIEADFGVPGAHIVTAATLWTDTANSDIIEDLTAWTEVYRQANGFRPGGMIVSTTVASALARNVGLRNLIAGVAGAPPILTRDAVDGLLAAFGLPTIRFVYDTLVTADDNSVVPILPANRAILVPPAGVELGFTQWGMTATGLELQNAGVQIVPSPAGMVAVVDKDVRPPYREAAYVDATCMPVLSRPTGLFVATVA